MKKIILILFIGVISNCYSQQSDSTENKRKWLIHLKSDTAKIRDTNVLKAINKNKIKKPYTEMGSYKNDISGYFNLKLSTTPIPNAHILEGSMLIFNMGIIKNKKIFVGLDISFGFKEIYTNKNISPYPTDLSIASFGIEGGYHLFPDKLITVSPIIKSSYTYLDINKGYFYEYYISSNSTLDKDWFLKTTIGTDLFLNVIPAIRIGIGAGYTFATGVNMKHFSNKDLNGISYSLKLQIHNSFFKTYKKPKSK